jgi:hypothetical protein
MVNAKKHVCFEAVSDILNTCSRIGIRRTYFMHPDVDEGSEIKHWLFASGTGTGMGCLYIELLWVNRDNPANQLKAEQNPERRNGMIIMNVGGKDFMKDRQPDWPQLEEKMGFIMEKWIPTKALPKPYVRISAMRKILFVDVLRCISICQKAGVDEIWLEDIETRRVWCPPLFR